MPMRALFGHEYQSMPASNHSCRQWFRPLPRAEPAAAFLSEIQGLPFQARLQFLVQSLARQRTAIALTPPGNQPLVRSFKTAIVGDRKCVKIAADRLPTCVGSGFRFRPFKESIRSSATKQAWESFEVFSIVMAAFKCWCRCLHIAFPILAHQPIPLNPDRRVVRARNPAMCICPAKHTHHKTHPRNTEREAHQ